MISDPFTRREFTVRFAAYLSGLGIAGAAGASRGRAQSAPPSGGMEISHTEESLHHEVTFKAPGQRAYELLTDARKFDRVVQLSDAMKGGLPPNASSASISRDAGGAFSLFAGMIGGRHIEMVPNERLVQAWRPANWKAGIYSIARFQLTDQDSGTKLVLDHTGFPKGSAQSLADGWKKNYWTPMERALA